MRLVNTLPERGVTVPGLRRRLSPSQNPVLRTIAWVACWFACWMAGWSVFLHLTR